MSRVILVDHQDRAIGIEEKIRAHQGPGMLHRAFSVFVFDGSGRLMVQRRAAGKYHFGGRWSNTACSHPAPGDNLVDAAERTLHREMGVTTKLRVVASLIYKATDAHSGLTEYEYDHLLVGNWEPDPNPNPSEVDEWTWVTPEALLMAIAESPGEYTPWLAIGLARLARLDQTDSAKP